MYGLGLLCLGTMTDSSNIYYFLLQWTKVKLIHASIIYNWISPVLPLRQDQGKLKTS